MPTLQTRKLNITRLNSLPRSHNCNCRVSIEPRQSGFNHCSYACNIPVSNICNCRHKSRTCTHLPARDRSLWLPSYSTKSPSYSMTLKVWLSQLAFPSLSCHACSRVCIAHCKVTIIATVSVS